MHVGFEDQSLEVLEVSGAVYMLPSGDVLGSGVIGLCEACMYGLREDLCKKAGELDTRVRLVGCVY